MSDNTLSFATAMGPPSVSVMGPAPGGDLRRLEVDGVVSWRRVAPKGCPLIPTGEERTSEIPSQWGLSHELEFSRSGAVPTIMRAW